MKRVSRPPAFFLFAAFLGAAGFTSAQTVGTSKKIIAEDPAAAELNRLLAAAQDAVNQQDYAAAARDYQAYLAKKPDDAVVHYDLGYAYTALQRPADAKAEYEKAIALDPKMASAYQNLGLTLIPTDPAAAIEPLQHAADLMPQDARTKWLLGVALEAAKKDVLAIEQYEAAAKLDPKSVDIRNSLGFALLKNGRAADAESAFRQAIALQPSGQAASEAHRGLLQALLAEKKMMKRRRNWGCTWTLIRTTRPCGWSTLPCWWTRARTMTRWPNSIAPPPLAPNLCARCACAL